MSQQDCVFCNIGRQPPGGNILYRDDSCFVIRDIEPKAPVHLLIIPYQHFTYLTYMVAGHEPMVGHLALVAEEMAKREGVGSHGYRLAINQGPAAGQGVAHLHMHLLGGHDLGPMG